MHLPLPTSPRRAGQAGARCRQAGGTGILRNAVAGACLRVGRSKKHEFGIVLPELRGELDMCCFLERVPGYLSCNTLRSEERRLGQECKVRWSPLWYKNI